MVLSRYQGLAGRSVLVTGGSSGIGASIVEAFARQQSKVAFVGRDAAAAQQVVSVSSRHGPAPLFLSCDLLDIAALREAIAQAAGANGPVTILVNNAASDDRHETAQVTPEYWDERMRINLRHQFFAIQSVAPMMREAHGGAVVNIGSNAWMMKHPFYPGYATAKAAVLGLTRAMAGELGPDNIRVNCISPGWTFTERQLRLWWSAEKEAALMQRQCLKHRIVPEDVAAAVLFLASDDARSITGQNLVVDCGES